MADRPEIEEARRKLRAIRRREQTVQCFDAESSRDTGQRIRDLLEIERVFSELIERQASESEEILGTPDAYGGQVVKWPLPEQSEEEDRDERWIHSPDREVADAD